MEKCSRKRVENAHFDPCLLQNAPAFRIHRIYYRCNREIWRLSHVWLVVYIIAWTRSSAVLSAVLYLSHSISLAPYLTTISRASYSVTYTLSRISIYLYYLLYLFFVLSFIFYYILWFNSSTHPFTPSAFAVQPYILCI